MVLKVLLVVGLATIANAQNERSAAYAYKYDVRDPYTGDNKDQYETRSGDVLQGRYSLDDPDGTRRIVDYTNDPVNGLRITVNKVPNGQAPVPPNPYNPYWQGRYGYPLTYRASGPQPIPTSVPGVPTGASTPVSPIPPPVPGISVAPSSPPLPSTSESISSNSVDDSSTQSVTPASGTSSSTNVVPVPVPPPVGYPAPNPYYYPPWANPYYDARYYNGRDPYYSPYYNSHYYQPFYRRSYY